MTKTSRRRRRRRKIDRFVRR